AATATFYVGWLVEALESYVLLRLVGAEISWAQLLALEASVAVIRSLTVFVPAGLGFQDAGYLAFFAAFKIPDATAVGTAFVILKRAKELVWVVVGYALLAAARAARRPQPAGSRPRILFICGSVHQTRQLIQVREALGDEVEARFTPYVVDGALRLCRALGLL